MQMTYCLCGAVIYSAMTVATYDLRRQTLRNVAGHLPQGA